MSKTERPVAEENRRRTETTERRQQMVARLAPPACEENLGRNAHAVSRGGPARGTKQVQQDLRVAVLRQGDVDLLGIRILPIPEADAQLLATRAPIAQINCDLLA